MTMLRCPTCHKQFDPQRSLAMPFCCERCRLIDLGGWLAEKHGLPWEPEDEADQPREQAEIDEDQRHEEPTT